MWEKCYVIPTFSIYAHFEAMWKPDSGSIVYKTFIFINSNLLSYKKLKTELKNP